MPPVELIAADLAPGDTSAAAMDWSGLRIESIRAPSQALFDRVYERMRQEFGPRGEIERRAVIAERLQWDPHRALDQYALLYELLAVMRGDELVAMRDHTAIAPLSGCRGAEPGDVVVHLSHVLVEPPLRRSGMAAWLRAVPLQTARACAAAAGLRQDTRVTLVAEMEPADGVTPTRIARLRSYERAGFLKLDPRALHYAQPDFRPAAEIEATGLRPIALDLVVRRVGRERERRCSGAEAHAIASALYAMFGVHIRRQHMAPLWARLAQGAGPDETLQLLPPQQVVG
jgi:hypothetical protein